jgi:RHS repeat-associated protein
MKRYIPILGLLLFIHSSFALEGIKEATVNQYNDFSQSWSYTQFTDNFVGGGGGNMSINITGDILTVSFNAGFSENKLKSGYVFSFTTSPGLPDMELGFLNLKNGTTLYNNDVKVSIASNALIFEHLAGNNNQVYTHVENTFQVDLTTLGGGGNIGEAPSATQNYIMTTIYQKGYTEGMEGNATDAEKISSVQYFDGLGRPLQTVGIRAGGDSEDIITHINYDTFGRQAKDYLPYVPTITGNNGSYRADALGSTNSFYDNANYEVDFPGMTTATINPYSQKLFEASPLNRVLQQAAPGASWKLGAGHEIKFNYQTNVAGEVKLYSASATWNATSGLFNTSLVNGTGIVFYGAGQLYKTITYDENTAATPTETNGSTVEFKNKQGQVVLKRTYNEGVKHDTYYVYDDYGNLTYVIPPKADVAITTAVLNELCYQYKYDYRNRLAEKKIPGKQWEFIVYDNLDRPVAAGPAFSPFTSPTGNGWLITKYDAFNRPVITAWMPSTVTSAGRKALQDARNAEDTNLSETKIATTTNTSINGIAFRYSNVAFPTSGYHVLTVNYFDDYNFPNAPAIPSTIEGQTVYYNTTVKPKGLPTGTWTRVLETSTLYKNETAYSLYDSKARPIRSYVKNYLGGYTYVDSKLDFTGKPEYTITKHKLLATSTELATREEFVYTDQGRLLTQTNQINGGTKQLIAKNDYDELGQLIGKKVGGTDITGATGLQTVDYAYNIRGWLKQINNPASLGTDLFGFKINYNTANHGAVPLYNGNISETEWKTQNDNVLRWYNYGYDALNRITKGVSSDGKFDLGATTNPVNYDKNGNIINLYRKGAIVANPAIGTSANYGIMDNLIYTYQTNSNRLVKVLDNGNDTFGFKDGINTTTEFTYDANGNMKTDANKGITAITYNHLNLPTSVTLPGGTISYIYDATGVKQKKIVPGKEILYAGNYIYESSKLQFFNTQEGYVTPKNADNYAQGFDYVYNYVDHLGNVRLSYTDANGNGTIETGSSYSEIVEENNYYPFGMTHKGYNITSSSLGSSAAKKYRFNGKELNESLGMNVIEMDFRQYDPALGRFTGMDRLTELAPQMTPYRFGFNNPISFSDPTGLYEIGENGEYIINDPNEIDSFMSHLRSNQHSSVEDFAYHIVTSDDFAESLPEVTINVNDIKSENNAKKNISSQIQNSLNNISAEKYQIDITMNGETLHDEVSVLGIGISAEMAFPFKIGTNMYGLGVSFGVLGDKDGTASYFTTKATYESGMAFGIQLESFQALKTNADPNSYISRSNLRGNGYETGFGVGPIGGSYGTSDASRYNRKSSYKVYSGSIGLGIDLGYVNWLTKTYIPKN